MSNSSREHLISFINHDNILYKCSGALFPAIEEGLRIHPDKLDAAISILQLIPGSLLIHDCLLCGGHYESHCDFRSASVSKEVFGSEIAYLSHLSGLSGPGRLVDIDPAILLLGKNDLPSLILLSGYL